MSQEFTCVPKLYLNGEIRACLVHGGDWETERHVFASHLRNCCKIAVQEAYLTYDTDATILIFNPIIYPPL